MVLQHLRCQRDDAHEAFFAELPPNRAEDAGAAGLAIGLQDHRCVFVELDVRAVSAATLFGGPYNHGLDDFTLLDVAARDSVLDGGDDDVADARVAATGSTEHPDAQDLLGTGVVGNLESRLLLDHLCSLCSDLSVWVVAIGTTDADKSVFLLGLLEDLDETPPLGGAQRPGFHDAYAVADG